MDEDVVLEMKDYPFEAKPCSIPCPKEWMPPYKVEISLAINEDENAHEKK